MVTEKDYENVDILELRSRKVNRNVCRALWKVDHAQVKRDLEKEQKRMTKGYTEKYNFDFEAGHPIDGRYKWKRGDASTSQDRPRRPSYSRKRQGEGKPIDEREQKEAKRSEKSMAKETSTRPGKLKKDREERKHPSKRKLRRIKGANHSSR